METTRVESFSDGVFAVAVTLLVLNLRDPGGTSGLSHRLLALWPNYTAYAVSFLVIGITWVNHHDTFARLRVVDRALLFLNLLLLMAVALIPFPTALVAEHLQANHESHAAAVAYGLVLTLVGLAFTALWVRAARHPELLESPHDSDYAWSRARRSVTALCAYGAAALIGLLSAAFSLILIGAVAVYFSLDRSFRPQVRGRNQIAPRRRKK
jgi:uncharacterized membrane protein